MSQAQHRLAALVFGPDDDVDALVAAFVADETGKGRRVAGVRQAVSEIDQCDGAVEGVDIATGRRFSLMQSLGPKAGACRVDPVAISEVGRILDGALAQNPDLIVVNRFGKLEAEEKQGVVAEISAAVAAGAAILVAVPQRFLDAWNAFAGGLDAQLPCNREALDDWWRTARR